MIDLNRSGLTERVTGSMPCAAGCPATIRKTSVRRATLRRGPGMDIHSAIGHGAAVPKE
ncbi:hypothetical protein [Methylobacterium sp. Leaf123]|uniref:hypothetical protein n=1 Tax=Methylobacterium sp. Leaf123 TaxID=1736264 RepID=UPI0012E92989|nr:hypothetical protein [Methylobacterium sp. Leaf123]